MLSRLELAVLGPGGVKQTLFDQHASAPLHGGVLPHQDQLLAISHECYYSIIIICLFQNHGMHCQDVAAPFAFGLTTTTFQPPVLLLLLHSHSPIHTYTPFKRFMTPPNAQHTNTQSYTEQAGPIAAPAARTTPDRPKNAAATAGSKE